MHEPLAHEDTLFTRPSSDESEAERMREALKAACRAFEEIRGILISNLEEPERRAFWLAVKGRDSCRTALSTSQDGE